MMFRWPLLAATLVLALNATACGGADDDALADPAGLKGEYLKGAKWKFTRLTGSKKTCTVNLTLKNAGFPTNTTGSTEVGSQSEATVTSAEASCIFKKGEKLTLQTLYYPHPWRLEAKRSSGTYTWDVDGSPGKTIKIVNEPVCGKANACTFTKL